MPILEKNILSFKFIVICESYTWKFFLESTKMEEITEELRKLKEELNVKFYSLFTIIESAKSASDLNESAQDKVDEDRIPQKYKLTRS